MSKISPRAGGSGSKHVTPIRAPEIDETETASIGSELPRTQLSSEIGGGAYAKLASKSRGFGRFGIAAGGVALAAGAVAILYAGGWLDGTPGASLDGSAKDPAREDLMDAALNGPNVRPDGPDVSAKPTNGTANTEPGNRVDAPDQPPVSVTPTETETPANEEAPGGRRILRRVEPNLPGLDTTHGRTMPNRIAPHTINGTNLRLGPSTTGNVQPGTMPGHH